MFSKVKISSFWSVTAIILAFIYYSININYNSPFNDEAIYIAIGRLGIYYGDWYTYNAASWMPGLPYLYPSLTALVYSLGGISASRIVNVFFGIASLYIIYKITYLISDGNNKQKALAGFFATFFLAFSPVSYYVSRLATYDIPSMLSLLLGIYLLLRVQEKEEQELGKYFFSASVFLTASYAIKIISGLFIPLIVLISFFAFRKRKKLFNYYVKYFLVTLIMFSLVFALAQFPYLQTYFFVQINRERVEIVNLSKFLIQQVQYLLPFWGVATLILIFKRNYRKLIILFTFSMLVVLFHFVTLRQSTFDKHLYLTVAFASITTGLGLGYSINSFAFSKKQGRKPISKVRNTWVVNMLTYTKPVNLVISELGNIASYWLSELLHSVTSSLQFIVKPMKSNLLLVKKILGTKKTKRSYHLKQKLTAHKLATNAFFVLALTIYSYTSVQEASKYNDLWENASSPLLWLSEHVKKNETVLSEIGATTIIYVDKNTDPTNVSTFDWFEYKGVSDISAYTKATYDGYFNYILLETESNPKNVGFQNLHEAVKNNLDDIYQIAFSDDNFIVYERQF